MGISQRTEVVGTGRKGVLLTLVAMGVAILIVTTRQQYFIQQSFCMMCEFGQHSFLIHSVVPLVSSYYLYLKFQYAGVPI